MGVYEKLKQLKDFELAFLTKYRLSTYMPSTQEKIMSEVKARGLSKVNLLKLIEDKLNEPPGETEDKKVCPRCKSDRILEYKKEKSFLSSSERDEISVNHKQLYDYEYICWICGYKLKSETDVVPTFWERLRGISQIKRKKK